MHNSVYRASYEPTDPVTGKARLLLPQIAFDAFALKFEKPTLDEGEFSNACPLWLAGRD